jgi:hypothetical protein
MKSTTKEGNQKIAIFMGASLIRTEEAEMPHGSHASVTMEYWKRPSDLPGYDDYADMGHFRYDRDWSWIMPVFEKISKMGYRYEIANLGKGPYCSIWLSETKEIGMFAETSLTAAWQTVVNFIDLYNSNQL